MAKFTCSNCGKELQGEYPACPYCKTIGSVQKTGPDKEKKSIFLLISAILGVLYALYSIIYWSTASSGTSGAAALGAGIATMLVMPHVIFAFFAAIFNVFGWAISNRGLALAGAILYVVAALMFPIYSVFVIAQIILSFVGFATLKH